MEDLNKIEIRGTIFISALAHELNFEDGTTLKGNPQLAKVFGAEEVTDWEEGPEVKKAKYEDVIPDEPKLQIKAPRYEPSSDGMRWLRENVHAASKKTLIVTSIIGQKAFGQGTVSPVVTPETSRNAPKDKIVFKYKWHAH